jgi:nitroreductase/NAD-dependent dihydropyrimidine dehydrogenase PreA subunit
MARKLIDAKRCTGCNRCIETCPLEILEQDTATGFPVVSRLRDQRCTSCGHCEAVCPEQAIVVQGESLQEASVAQENANLTPRQVAAYFAKRRSIRLYKDEPVDKAVLEELLDIARHAPSGVNRQPVRWSVVHSAGSVHALAGLTVEWMRGQVGQQSAMATMLHFDLLIDAWDRGKDPICRNAPHCIFAFAPKEDRMAATDGTIALSHLELAAPAFGLGACWAGYLNIATNSYPALKSAAGIPADNVGLGVLMIGRPRYEFARTPKRNRAHITWH